MSELDLLRDTLPTPPPAGSQARARARARLFSKIDSASRGRHRVRSLSLAGAVAATALVTAVFLSVGTSGSHSDAAAAVLHKAARAALGQPGLGTLEPGQYVYTKSEVAYLSTIESSYSALVPQIREVWLGRDRTGWLHTTSGTPTFPSAHDRELWIAAGRPNLGGNASEDTALGNDGGPSFTMDSLDLPTNPDALYAHLAAEAAGNANGVSREMFTLIGDDLRNNYTTPAQRAALFDVAARLPGVELVGDVTDPAGRAGVAVAMVEQDMTREELVFDRTSYELLSEEQAVISGNSLGYPAGTVIGHATYLEQAIVDALKQRP